MIKAPVIIHEYEDPATGLLMYQTEDGEIYSAYEFDQTFFWVPLEEDTDELEPSAE